MPKNRLRNQSNSVRSSHDCIGTLRDMLAQNMKLEASHKRKFISRDCLDQIWSNNDLRDYVLGLGIGDWSFIEGNLIKTLSILAWIHWDDWSQLAQIFASHTDSNNVPDRLDKDLPYEDNALLARTDFLSNSYFASRFYEDQFIFLPVVLIENRDLEFPRDRRLPFVSETESLGTGSYGTVTKVVVAKGHFMNAQGNTVSWEKPLARKRLEFQPDFRKEVQNLRTLKRNQLRHQRIMQHCGSLIHGNNCNIFFEWADFNAQDLLSERCDARTCFDVTPRNLLWEASYLAGALWFLHHKLDDIFCCHMNLKPDNILVVQDGESPVGQWMITDFGISVFFKEPNRNKTNNEFLSVRELEENIRHQTTTTVPQRRPGPFQPPEVESIADAGKVGRKGNVWSFGCVLAMVLAFALGGRRLVEEFDRIRGSDDDETDYFYHFASVSVGTRKAQIPEIKPGIFMWLHALPQRFAEHSIWIPKCVDLIKETLTIEQTGRPECKDVKRILREICYEMNGMPPPNAVAESFSVPAPPNGRASPPRANSILPASPRSSRTSVGVTSTHTPLSVRAIQMEASPNIDAHPLFNSSYRPFIDTTSSLETAPRASQVIPDYIDGNSEIESVSSEVASVFSDDPSISSASSAAVLNTDLNFAFEIAKALLEDDEMNESITAFIETVLPTGQEKAQRRLLKAVREYAKELQKTAQNPLELLVANFVRGRYLVIARTMERFGKGNDEGSATASFAIEELDNLIEVRVTGLEKVPDYLRDLPSDVGARIGTVEKRDKKQDENVLTHADEPIESDSSSVDEQPEGPEKTQERLPHIAIAKDFLLGGAPFANLLSMIQELVEKPKETKKSTKISEEMEYVTPDDREKNGRPADSVNVEALSELRLPKHMASLSLYDVRILGRIHISWSDQFKAFAERYSGEAWNWWPLSPRSLPLSPGNVRIQWACKCWADMSEESVPKYLELLWQNPTSRDDAKEAVVENNRQTLGEAIVTPNRLNPTDPSVSKLGEMHSDISTANQGTNSSPPTSNSLGNSSPGSKQSSTPTAAANQASILPSAPGSNLNPRTTSAAGTSRARSNSPNAQDFYILFCAYRGRTLRHTQIDVSKHNDDQFFEDLRREYKSMRGWFRYYFDPRQFDHCDFVKFTRFYVGELARICHELPHDSEYHYQPRPPALHDDPPIVPHEFYRRFYYVKNTCLSLPQNEALSRIPKRRKRFQVNLHVGGREDMWGLHAEIRPFFWMVAAWMLIILVGGFVFWGWWMSRHPGDWQNASVPFTAVLGCMMMLLLPLNEKFKSPS